MYILHMYISIYIYTYSICHGKNNGFPWVSLQTAMDRKTSFDSWPPVPPGSMTLVAMAHLGRVSDGPLAGLLQK